MNDLNNAATRMLEDIKEEEVVEDTSEEEVEEATPEEEDLESDESVEEEQEEETTEEETDSPEEDDMSEESEEDQLYSIVVDGQEKTLTLEELKTNAQMGLDYTQKTSKLAEERKTFEETANTVKQQVVQQLEVANKLLSMGAVSQQELDRLAEEDPEEYTRVKHQEEKRVRAIQYVASEITKAKQEETKVQQQELLKQQAEGYKKLVTTFPEFETNSDQPSEAGLRLATYLKQYGFTDEEISTIPRGEHFIIAEKARKWDEYQESLKKAQPQKKLKSPVPKVTKKSSARSDRSQQSIKAEQSRKRLKSTGSINDAVGALLSGVET